MPECFFQLRQFGLLVLQGSLATGFGCVDEIVCLGAAESTHLNASTSLSLVLLKLNWARSKDLLWNSRLRGMVVQPRSDR